MNYRPPPTALERDSISDITKPVGRGFRRAGVALAGGLSRLFRPHQGGNDDLVIRLLSNRLRFRLQLEAHETRGDGAWLRHPLSLFSGAHGR